MGHQLSKLNDSNPGIGASLSFHLFAWNTLYTSWKQVEKIVKGVQKSGLPNFCQMLISIWSSYLTWQDISSARSFVVHMNGGKAL